jgi:uncharacterized protein
MENYIIILLCITSFFAGFVDAVVGGGGLIQTPISLLLLPNIPVANIIGTLKIPGISGTSFASYQYIKKVKINWKLLFPIALISCGMSFFGSYLLTKVHNEFMKPILIVVLILVAIYTFIKKDFIGFYDGFIGPGTGSFLVLALISLLGFDFLNASANAKLINVATNLGSIFYFLISGKIIWAMALPMAVCNSFGGWLGAKTALKKGNDFIRIFFLIVVVGTLFRLFYDVFLK